MDTVCNICNAKISNKRDLLKHQKTEKCQNIKRCNELILKNIDYEKIINKQKETIEELNNNIEKLKLNFQNKLNEKDLTISSLENNVKSLEEQSKNLKEKSEEYRRIVEKAATKSTTIKNTYTNNSNNHNNYLNYISQEPIKFSEMKKQIENVITTKTIMYDDDDFHEHIVDNILRDNKGKDKVLCTDINRKNFSYKDETSGQLISDPELERLREQLKKGTDTKKLKKDLLDKLIKKYDGTNIDPYNKFYDILKKLDFGTLFIDHVAKKTYVKTKPNNENNENNENLIIENNIIENNDIINKNEALTILDNKDVNEFDNFEEINKIYNQLKDEFE